MDKTNYGNGKGIGINEGHKGTKGIKERKKEDEG
jgi:hypothetical protein